MEMKIIEEKENPFFKRKEIKVELNHASSATPSKQELMKEIASKFSAAEDCIVIDYILSKKGKNEAVAKVKVYSEPVAKKVEKVEAQASQAK